MGTVCGRGVDGVGSEWGRSVNKVWKEVEQRDVMTRGSTHLYHIK